MKETLLEKYYRLKEKYEKMGQQEKYKDLKQHELTELIENKFYNEFNAELISLENSLKERMPELMSYLEYFFRCHINEIEVRTERIEALENRILELEYNLQFPAENDFHKLMRKRIESISRSMWIDSGGPH